VTGSDYAAMSDPARNPQFRRCWTGPPDGKRKRPAAATRGAPENIDKHNDGVQVSDLSGAVKPVRDRP